MAWVKRLVDGVTQDDLGHADIEMVWDDLDELDPKVQEEIDDKQIRSGRMSINEWRAGKGLAATAGGDAPMIYTATGAMPLDLIREGALAQVNPPTPTPDAAQPDAGGQDDKALADA
jgi:hypothetical protein